MSAAAIAATVTVGLSLALAARIAFATHSLTRWALDREQELGLLKHRALQHHADLRSSDVAVAKLFEAGGTEQCSELRDAWQ